MANLTEAYECPNCKADLKRSPLPETARCYYDNAEFFTRAIELYGKGWQCPECGHKWLFNDNTATTSEDSKE